MTFDDVSWLQVCSIELFRWKSCFYLCPAVIWDLDSTHPAHRWYNWKRPQVFWAVSVLCSVCWVILCVPGFGTNSQGELHLPALSVKALPPGNADVTLHELVILLGWVSCVYPAVSSHLCLLDGLVFTHKVSCFLWQSD